MKYLLLAFVLLLPVTGSAKEIDSECLNVLNRIKKRVESIRKEGEFKYEFKYGSVRFSGDELKTMTECLKSLHNLSADVNKVIKDATRILHEPMSPSERSQIDEAFDEINKDFAQILTAELLKSFDRSCIYTLTKFSKEKPKNSSDVYVLLRKYRSRRLICQVSLELFWLDHFERLPKDMNSLLEKPSP